MLTVQCHLMSPKRDLSPSELMSTISIELTRHGSWDHVSNKLLVRCLTWWFNAVTLRAVRGHQMWEVLLALSKSLCVPIIGLVGRDK